MLKYAKVIDENTGLCEIGVGTNINFYKSIGMSELDVKKSEKDNNWYLKSKCVKKINKFNILQIKDAETNSSLKSEYYNSYDINKTESWLKFLKKIFKKII